MAQKLQNKPVILRKIQVAEVIVLEQFLEIFPIKGKEWVQQHHLTLLPEAVSLIEDYLDVEGSEA